MECNESRCHRRRSGTLGFDVEQGKQKAGKLPRPVFFGDEGTYLRTYEIDAFEPRYGIALEVEAGRATMGNAIYRDLIQGSLMVDAASWCSQCRSSTATSPALGRRRSRATRRRTRSWRRSTEARVWQLPFEGLLLIGY